MSQKFNTAIAVIGIDIGKNSFHVVGDNQQARDNSSVRYNRLTPRNRNYSCKQKQKFKTHFGPPEHQVARDNSPERQPS